MSCYLDTSVLVPLFLLDPFNGQAEAFLRENREEMVISDFGIAEFCSVVARRVRSRDLTGPEGQQAFLHFDQWMSRSARRADTTSEDVRTAEAILRRLDLDLRAPDAIHVVGAQRLGATLVTFDRQMAASARALGTAVETP